MFYYTYFIISPGAQMGSSIRYRNVSGNYIKFGDSKSAHEDHTGIRGAYLTHNPDIGIMAVMNSQVFQSPGLGTRLKNYMVSLDFNPVGSSEWFSVGEDGAWSLARAMLDWDEAVLTAEDQQALQGVIHQHLLDPMDVGAVDCGGAAASGSSGQLELDHGGTPTASV